MMIHRNTDLQISQDFIQNVLPMLNGSVECMLIYTPDNKNLQGWFIESPQVLH